MVERAETIRTEEAGQIKKEPLLFTALFINILLAVMTASMFNIALPSIAMEYSLSAKMTSWIITIYSITYAICVILYGRLASKFKLQSLIFIGMSLMALGSIFGLLSDHFMTLVIARIIQGIGAGAPVGVVYVIISNFVPMSGRAKALGIVSGAVTLSFGLGPLLSGMIIEFVGWRGLFYVSILSIITIPIYYICLPNEQVMKIRFDFIGFLLFSIGVLSLLMVIATSSIIAGFGLLSFFVFYQHIKKKKEEPFIHPDLLRNKFFLAMLFLGFLSFVINFSMLFILPLLLTNVHDVSPGLIGGLIFPGAIISMFFSLLFIQRIANFSKPAVLLNIGFILHVISCMSFFMFGSRVPIWLVSVFYLLTSVGYVCLNTAIPNLMMNRLSKQEINTGLGVFQLGQYSGTAIGVSIVGKILDVQTMFFNLPFWQVENFMYGYAFIFLLLLCFIGATIINITSK